MMLFNMFAERKSQLGKQEIIDKTLTTLTCKCPALVSEYLLLQRRVTRIQQYKIIDTGVFALYEEMQVQLGVNNTITNRFLDIKQPLTCAELKKIISEQ